MVLTKQYLRFVPSGLCNIVASSSSNVCYFDQKTCLVGACENVYAWDLKCDENVACFTGSKTLCVVIRCSPDRRHFAVGYADGSINIFDRLDKGSQVKVTFTGHKSSVTCLDYSQDGLLLASGGKDCVAIIWDIVNESGLCKLMGHQAPITQCRFAKNAAILMTSSKDSLIKFWDLSSQHCVYTLADHRSEVWDFVLTRQENQLITGSAENELRIFDVTWLADGDQGGQKTDDLATDDETTAKRVKFDDEEDPEQANNVVRLRKVGTLLRQGKGRVTQLAVSLDEKILLCLGTGTVLDAYSVLSAEQTKERIKKKKRKLAKKIQSSTVDDNDNAQCDEEAISRDITTRFLKLTDVKLSEKIKCLSFSSVRSNTPTDGQAEYKVALLFHNNAIKEELLITDYSKSAFLASAADRTERRRKPPTVGIHGHRADVRHLSFSNDSTAFLSAAADGALKIWNRASTNCVRTLHLPSTASPTTAAFIVGDRHCVVGDKEGNLSLHDIGSCEVVEYLEGHSGSISSLCFTPDQKTVVTGSSDKSVKFWDFELVPDDEKKKLSLTLNKSLQLSDEVLCCKVSDNGKFLAVGLLDNTSKIYYVDTLKFFLCLYGHSLPVLCLDISYDSSLIITGSADKNVKIWGMDFGDCHKSLFAHDDSVTCVKFINKTHLFFSAGKDGKIKQWDADNFEKILVLSDHHSEIWALDTSINGKYLVSGSHDKSIRVFEKTDEILVLQEEQELEREAEYEKSLEQQDDVVAGESANKEVTLATKKSVETIKSAEDIIDAIDIIRKETEEDLDKTSRIKHPLILAYGSQNYSAFLVDVIRRVKSSELEKCLLLLPFAYILEILEHLANCLGDGYSVELCCRCVLFLIKIHHGVLLTSSNAAPILDRLKESCAPQINEIRDLVGFNIAALKFLQLELAEKQQVQLFGEAKEISAQKRKKRKERVAYVIS